MADYKLEMNLNEINEAVKKAFKETALLYKAENVKVISEVGAFPSHPDSDIVNTTNLRKSTDLQFTGDLEAELSWNVEYAVYVHEGYVKRNGTVIIGRPWTTKARERLDIQRTFSTLIDENLV